MQSTILVGLKTGPTCIHLFVRCPTDDGTFVLVTAIKDIAKGEASALLLDDGNTVLEDLCVL